MGLARSSNEAGFGYATADGNVGLFRVGVGNGVTAWAAASRSRLSLSFLLFFPSFQAFPFGFRLVSSTPGFIFSFLHYFFFYVSWALA